MINDAGNRDAEQGLLAACIIDQRGETISMCVEGGLLEEHFSSTRHQAIYSVLLDLHREGERIDETLMAERLSRSGKLDEVGWQTALAALTSRIETSAHAAYWLKLVQEKHAGSGSNDTPNP